MTDFNYYAQQFPQLNASQIEQLEALVPLYEEWNEKINVVSRKDIERLNERHLAHSLSIILFDYLKSGQRVMDLGTGGGFPGIPLAIAYPDTHFVLVDSIGKKITVCKAIIEALKLTNVEAHHERAESIAGSFDWVVTRAVAPLKKLRHWTHKKIKVTRGHSGILALKGGDLTEEIKRSQSQVVRHQLREHLPSPFFEEKELLWVKY